MTKLSKERSVEATRCGEKEVARQSGDKRKRYQEHDTSRKRYGKEMLREKDAKRKAYPEKEMSRGRSVKSKMCQEIKSRRSSEKEMDRRKC